MHKADDPRCYVGDVVEATETDDGLAITGRFDLDTEFGNSAYRNTEDRRVSGLSIGYTILNSTKTGAGNELTELESIEASIVARGPMTGHSSADVDDVDEDRTPGRSTATTTALVAPI